MSDPRNAPDLTLCLDLAVPAGARLAVWSDNGRIRIAEAANGRRFMLFAEPGAQCFLMGFPETILEDADELKRWYASTPVARPVWFEVDEFGEAIRLPGEQAYPAAALADPRFLQVQSLMQVDAEREVAEPVQASATAAEEVTQASVDVPADTPLVGPPAAEAPATEKPVPEEPELLQVLTLEQAPGARILAFGIHGEPVRVESAERLSVFAPEGASFAVAQIPADPDADLASYLDAHPQARAMAYTVAGGRAEVDLAMLGAIERRVARRGEDGMEAGWAAALRESENARARTLRAQAVAARALRAYVEEQGRAPRAIAGTDSTLYVEIADAPEPGQLPRVAGVLADGTPAQVLRVDVTAEGAETSVLYAPAGGAYILMPQDVPADVEAPGEAIGIALRPGGDRVKLGANERARIWSEARPLDVVHANPARVRIDPALSETPAQPALLEEPPMLDDMWEGTFVEPTPEELAAMHDFEAEASGEEPAPRETRLTEPLTWHGPDEGYTNLRNWRQHSPRGELWMAELLAALVDRNEDLDALGCLVPIQMLRQGYALTTTDKDRFQRAVDGPLADRLGDVRVFEIDAHTFFARETTAGIRLVGPRGGPVKSADVRTAILGTYGRSPDAPVVDPAAYQHPSASRLTLRRGRKAATR